MPLKTISKNFNKNISTIGSKLPHGIGSKTIKTEEKAFLEIDKSKERITEIKDKALSYANLTDSTGPKQVNQSDTITTAINNTNELIPKDSNQSKYLSIPLEKIALNKTRFYYGFTVGLAFNQVKNQHLTNPGWNAGIVVGLQLNNHFAIETGLQFSQKKYYSTGIYFHPKSGTMPSNMVIKYLYGKSNLIEIPVNIKYNFQASKDGFYLITGLSSYLMTTEINRYMADINGEQKEINSTYNSMHNYLSSMLNFGIGYQFHLTRKTNAQLEPYLQIPVRGMGIGSLQVKTMGLHFIIRKQ